MTIYAHTALDEKRQALAKLSYSALNAAEQRLARPVQATIRDRAWLESGSGAFHDTVTSRPIFRLPLPDD